MYGVHDGLDLRSRANLEAGEWDMWLSDCDEWRIPIERSSRSPFGQWGASVLSHDGAGLVGCAVACDGQNVLYRRI